MWCAHSLFTYFSDMNINRYFGVQFGDKILSPRGQAIANISGKNWLVVRRIRSHSTEADGAT
jgi:hypothetical protein